METRAKMGIAVASVVAAGAVGWVSGRSIQSPDEAAANAKAPVASPITVEVEKRALSTQLILRGNVGYSLPFDVNLGTSSSGTGAASAYVTRTPEVGSTVNEGASMMDISGRPVIALQGLIPMYRDLKVGSEGDDVQALEAALERLGYSPGAVDGNFDAATAGAVTRMYDNAGSTPPLPSDELRTQLRDAQNAVTSAQRAVSEAQRSAASGSTKASEIQQAQQAVTDAQEAATKARTQADKDLQTVRDALTDATTARDEANRALTKLKNALTSANSGTNPQTGLPATTPEEIAALNALKIELEDQIATAQISYDKTVREVQRATEGIPEQQRANEAAIRQADNSIRLAETQLAEVLDPSRSSTNASAVADAQQQAAQAREALAEIARDAGVTVPASEIAFVPALPGRLDTTSAAIGKAPSNPVATISGTNLGIESSVRVGDRKYVKVGMEVEAEASDLDITVKGTISEIDEKPGGHEVGESNVWLSIALAETPEGLSGASVKITIPVSSTSGEVLTVPLAALSIDGGGSARVEVQRDDDQRAFVPVTVGLVAEGSAEISPRGDAALKEGDLVIVGTKGASEVAKKLGAS